MDFIIVPMDIHNIQSYGNGAIQVMDGTGQAEIVCPHCHLDPVQHSLIVVAMVDVYDNNPLHFMEMLGSYDRSLLYHST